MKAYIYFIINNITNERYVGQTTDFSRRKKEHFTKLENNQHPNPKLQNSYNKYTKNNFKIEKITYENISKQELDEMEKFYISKYDAQKNGFNLTEGGTGGNIRGKIKFEDYCYIYFGNKQYKGLTNKTAKKFNIDSSTVSAIAREISYDEYRQKAQELPDKEKENYLKKFYEDMNLAIEKPWTVSKTPDAETTFNIMCVVSSYGRGIESVILKKFGLSKGFIFHLMTGNGRQEIKNKYNNLSEKEITEIGQKYFEIWNLQSLSKTQIKKKYNNLNNRYKS